jgi:uncharacterized protein
MSISFMALGNGSLCCVGSNKLTQYAVRPAEVKVTAQDLVRAARAQVGVTTDYDPAYVSLPYPGGDVPAQTGVCSDVVVRAFRGIGIDLQKEVHEDMRANFSKYPKKWGLKRPDANIDHRRVLNLMTWFARQGKHVPVTSTGGDYRPGDVVSWTLPGNLPHMGIISDRNVKGTDRFKVIHNIGEGAQEEDILFIYPIVDHARWFQPSSR